MTDSNYDHDLLLQAKRIAPSRQNKDLKDLNHSQGLRVSGNKTELSARILERKIFSLHFRVIQIDALVDIVRTGGATRPRRN